jgi:DNA-binding transcriptional MocR family regulator
VLWPLSRYYKGKNARHGFVLGFGSTPAEHIPSAVKRLHALILGMAVREPDLNYAACNGTR